MRQDLKVAYLTGEYPKASHTFILREIAALRRLGVEILPASIRRPDQANLIGPDEVAAEAETFYVLEAARKLMEIPKSHLGLLFGSPGRYVSGLGLALRTGRPGLRGLLRQIIYFAEAGILARHFKANDVTHIHNHFADSSANVSMLTAHLADIPFSYTLHGPAELFEPTSWHLKEKVRRAATTVCISFFARSQAMLFSDPTDWPKLRIVHCGVSPDLYDAPARAQDGELKLLFVGRITQIKGLRVLFEAIELARKDGAKVSLSVIGDGDDRAWAEEAAAKIGGITLLGFRSQEEVAAELAQSDALVLPSFAEGVPVVLMEAMAAGKPVIATRVGGVSELVEDGVSGYLVAPGDVVGLSEIMRRLSDTPDQWQKMGAAGREKVRAEFDIDAEAARLYSVFTQTAGDQVRPPKKDAN